MFMGPVQNVGRVWLPLGRCHPLWLAEVQSHTYSLHHGERGLGHYSRFFLTPKRTEGLRPPMNLLPLNQAVVKRRFRIYHFGDDYQGSRPKSSGYLSRHDGFISTYTHAPAVPSVSMIGSANSRAFKVCLSMFETSPRS